MNKKVIDIIVPKEKGAEHRSALAERKKRPGFQIKRPKFPISLSLTGKKILVLGTVVLISAGIFGYFTLSKVSLEIWPKTDTLNFQTKLTIDKAAEASDPAFWIEEGVIPGKVFAKAKTITESFSSSGRILKEGKARGVIRVYNEYSTRHQVLIARTRFVSADGKLFRTPNRVIIPGGRYERGRLIPGEIDIEVVADEPGAEYNIGPSAFSIPGFAGTARFTKFYAKSFQPMTGGFSREVIQVTKEDIERAKEALTERAKKELEASFKNELRKEEILSEFNFLEKAIKIKILEAFALAEVEEETEDFNFQVKTEAKTLLFRKEDLKNFVKEFIGIQIAEEKQVHQPSLKTNYSLVALNLNEGKMTLSLEMVAKIYPSIDIIAFKNALRGRSSTETKIFLENQPAITKVEIVFWPFWVKSVPEDLDRIKIELKFD